MMLALGTGGYVAAIFHLFTHAFFKALLFLGSGSVNHATGTFDMRKMGGLRKYMPITYATFVIGSLSLAGIFPFAGFWSKDEILARRWRDNKLLFAVAMAVVFMTAFYTFRAIFLTFHGEYKGGEPPRARRRARRARRARRTSRRWVMTLPLLILAVPAVLAGFVNFPSHGTDGARRICSRARCRSRPPKRSSTRASTGASPSLDGARARRHRLAYAVYQAKVISAESLQKMWGPVHTLVAHKYYMDDLYEDLIVRDGLYNFGLPRSASGSTRTSSMAR